MLEFGAKALVWTLEVYSGVGIAFASVFACIGVQRLDTAAQGSGVGFRALILPGVVAFWPLFLSRWLCRVTEPPVEQNPHRRVSRP